MALLVTDRGQQLARNLLLTHPPTWYHLYVGDTPITRSTRASDFTEASFRGYQSVWVKYWTNAVMTGVYAWSVGDPVLWSSTFDGPPNVVYGYFVTEGQHGELILAERRSTGPITIQHAGDSLVVFPRLTLRNDPMPE